jgi:uncharacterized protein (TIGR02466 family)
MMLERWFSTPIWFENTVFNFDRCASKCIDITKTHSNRFLSNVGGWQSTDIDLLKYEELKPIHNIITQKITEFSKDIGPNAKLSIDNCWLNVNYKGHYNEKHVHPVTLFSGVIYISVNENSGNIIFHNNTAAEHYVEIRNNESDLFYKTVTYKPKNGMILIFPAWLHHSVTPNLSDDPRISIAFNIRQ